MQRGRLESHLKELSIHIKQKSSENLLRGTGNHIQYSVITCKGKESEKGYIEISLGIPWIRLRLPMQGVQIRSLVRKLTAHMPRGQKKTKHKAEAIP